MKKYIFILLSIVLTLGLVAGVSFAQERGNRDLINCYGNEQMINLMRENGFEEMAILMENGDRDGMREIMSNLSDEDFTRMQEIMNENGYGSINMQKRMTNRMLSGRGFVTGSRCRQ